MERLFNVHTAEEIPPLHNNVLNISDWFCAKVKVIDGSLKNGLVCYDFTYKKWMFLMSGHIELIEYYTE